MVPFEHELHRYRQLGITLQHRRVEQVKNGKGSCMEEKIKSRQDIRGDKSILQNAQCNWATWGD